MDQPALSKLKSALPLLSVQAWEGLKRRCEIKLAPDEPVSSADCLLIAFGEWLFHLHHVSDAEVYDLLLWARDDIKEHAELLEQQIADSQNPTAFTFTLGDGRYATYTGRNRWYELLRGVEHEEVSPMVTFIVCDVTALYRRLIERLLQTEGP